LVGRGRLGLVPARRIARLPTSLTLPCLVLPGRPKFLPLALLVNRCVHHGCGSADLSRDGVIYGEGVP
jgi:hypothetical protein